METKNENTFEYTYSAKKQEEIEKIKSKYVDKEADKMELLRKLDRDVEKPGTMAAIIIGVVGALIMGAGMSCVMVWQDTLMIPGIVIGVIGIAILSAAYPVYKRITKKQKEKIAPQILALSEELLK